MLKKARSLCDSLGIGATTDEIATFMKGKKPIIPYEERYEIVKPLNRLTKQ